ncbi:MAG: hypothetical protein RLZZ242_1282 [Bacteroidota bacterium]
MKTQGYKGLKTILKVAVSAALLYLVFSKLGVSEVWETLKQVSIPHLLFATLLVLFSKWIAHLRLLHYLKSITLIVPLLTHWKLYLQGMFYNLFLPGGIGGDAYKAYILSRNYPVKLKRIISVLLLDRLSGLVALTLLTLVLSSIYFAQNRGLGAGQLLLIVPYLKYAALLLPLPLFGFYLMKRLWFRYALPAYSTTLYASLALQAIQVGACYLLLLGLGYMDSAWPFLLLFTLSSILSVLPISLGGIGLREITFLYGAQWLTIDSEIAVALSVLFFISNALVSLLGIFYHLNPVLKDNSFKADT